MELDEFKREVSAGAANRGVAVAWVAGPLGAHRLVLSGPRFSHDLLLELSGPYAPSLVVELVDHLVEAASESEPRDFQFHLSRSEPGVDADLGRRLVEIVRRFRDRHEITCPETIYQVDRVVQESYGLVEELVEAVGYGRLDDESDYVPPEAG